MNTLTVTPLHPLVYRDVVRRALAEDFGRGGDLTTEATVPADARAVGRVVARAAGRTAGVVFREVDPDLEVVEHVTDGVDVAAGTTLITVRGTARSILTAERTALNLLGRLSGVATLTAAFVLAVAGTRARVVDTRKTTPGLRALEKYAVRCGGGANHRFGLDDAVLIKDNHLVLAGGMRAAVEAARARVGHMVRVEVEVDTLEQLAEAIEVGVEAVLLDNMDPATLRAAVTLVDGLAVTEASGGITLATAAAVAAAGVDLLSVGALTHSAPALDVALDVAPVG